MSQLVNTNTNKPKGTKPNQEIEKNFTKFKVLNPFSKRNPTKVKPKIFCII